MGFKEILRQDVHDVFLNPDEFGEPHVINGEEYMIIIDDNEELERRITKGAFAYREGNYRAQRLFYVSARAFGRLPVPGRSLVLDGKTYLITDASDESGVYAVSLEAVRA